MIVYVAGPMSKIPYYNFPAFKQAAATLRQLGHTVVSPAELDEERGIEPDPIGTPLPDDVYDAVMADDLDRLEGVDAIYLLQGWHKSSGARKELAKALDRGLTILLEPVA